MRVAVRLCLVVAVFVAGKLTCADGSPLLDFIDGLIMNYDPTFILVGRNEVSLTPLPIRIIGLDRIRGILEMELWKEVSWLDEQLAWSPDDVGDVSFIEVENKHVWSPYELIDLEYGTERFASTTKARQKVHLHSSGETTAPVHTIVEVPCVQDGTAYHCSMVYVLTSSYPVYFRREPAVHLDVSSIKTPRGLTVVNATREVRFVEYDCCPTGLQTVATDLTVRVDVLG